MVENDNFLVSTEGLTEKGNEINNEAKAIKEALADIDTARKTLDGWVSQNKDKFDSKVANLLPKMYEIVEILESFGGVAINTSERATDIEAKIAASIDSNVA